VADKYKQEIVIEAIRRANGMVYVAAQKLGCSPQTIYNYAKRHPAIQTAIEDQRGILLDTAELALLKAITKGEGWAVCFALKTLGKSRGFVEGVGKDGDPIKLIISFDDGTQIE
jgi:hypothetical protein